MATSRQPGRFRAQPVRQPETQICVTEIVMAGDPIGRVAGLSVRLERRD